VFDWIKEILNPPPKVELDDPYFGRIVFAPKVQAWTCQMQNPLSENQLYVYLDEANIEGPSEFHRTKMQQLIEKFPQLQSKINQRLFQEWNQFRSALDTTEDWFHKFDLPDKVNEVFSLYSIRIRRTEIILAYFYDVDIWPDGSVWLIIDESWNVEYGGSDD
jgi:hypothetical protein